MVIGARPTFTVAVASARMTANTIIGMPTKCVAILRRSRWYAAYRVSFSAAVFMRERGSLQPLLGLLADLELAERRPAHTLARLRLLRGLGGRWPDAGVAQQQTEGGGRIRGGERLVGGDLALRHQAGGVL